MIVAFSSGEDDIEVEEEENVNQERNKYNEHSMFWDSYIGMFQTPL